VSLPLSLQEIRAAFPGQEFARGNEYQQQGFVLYTDVDDDEISSSVMNARGKEYEQTISFRKTRHGYAVTGYCECPMEYNCKHVAAVLLELYYEKDAKNTPRPTVTTVAPSAAALSPAVTEWLNSVTRAASSIGAPGKATISEYNPSFCLLYILKPDLFSPVLTLKLQLVRRLLKGGYGKPKDVHHTLSNPDMKHLTSEDVLILHNLQHINDNDTLYPQILDTGRCHFQDMTTPALELAVSLPTTPVWRTNEKGEQKFVLDAPDNTSIFVLDNTCWYINRLAAQMGKVITDMDPQTVLRLLRSPPIPARSAPEVNKTLQARLTHTPLPVLKEFKIQSAGKVKPQPHLHLSTAAVKFHPAYGQDWRQSHEKSLLLARVSFLYQTIEISWQDPNPEVSYLQQEQVFTIKRDIKQEQAALDQLSEHPFMLLETLPKIDLTQLKHHAPEIFPKDFALDIEKVDPYMFNHQGLAQLKKQGWQISVADDYPYHVLVSEETDWYTDVEKNEGQDWFDLELGIILEGEKVNLLPIIQRLLSTLPANAQASTLAGLDPESTIFIELPDKRRLPIAGSRLNNILHILTELYDHKSLTDDERLRLSRLQAARLLELEEAIGAARLRWLGNDALRQLAYRLKHFEQISIVPIPAEFNAQLRAYQHAGLNWLQFLREYELAGVLADDMGLGKTVQALAHISVEKARGALQTPALVIAPTSLMYNWLEETKKFAPTLNCLLLHGSERKFEWDKIATVDIVITSYPLLVRDKEIHLQNHYHLLMMD
jgi:hypothetical protein